MCDLTLESEKETLVRDLARAFFIRDSDVRECVESWFNGPYFTDESNDSSLIERLKFLKGLARQHASREVLDSAEQLAAEGVECSGGNTRVGANSPGAPRLALVECPDEHEHGGIGA